MISIIGPDFKVLYQSFDLPMLSRLFLNNIVQNNMIYAHVCNKCQFTW